MIYLIVKAKIKPKLLLKYLKKREQALPLAPARKQKIKNHKNFQIKIQPYRQYQHRKLNLDPKSM